MDQTHELDEHGRTTTIASACDDSRQRLELAVEHYLQECYKQRTAVRANELASKLNISPQHLGRLSRDLLGMRIGDFLLKQQLAYATEVLRVTPLTYRDVAAHCGFGVESTFHRAVRRVFQMPASELRRRSRFRNACGLDRSVNATMRNDGKMDLTIDDEVK
jgi:AraC-like DNA-binding protein